MDAELGECPYWIAGASRLAWVDIAGQRYATLDPATGATQTHRFPHRVGSAAPIDAGTAILATDDGLYRWRLDRPLERLPSPDMRGITFNDGKCDSAGRFWIGSRARDGSSGGGTLFRFEGGVAPEPIASGFDVCNGMGWSPDGRFFYLIDTVPRHLYRFHYDAARGALGHRELLSGFEGVPGKPDGLAVDAVGRIWCAMWDGSGIVILSPQGVPIDWLPTPCPRPTSCAFGDTDLRTLYVTSARIGLNPDDPAFGASGALLAYRLAVAGQPVARFAG
ncbi:hypothetical protein BXU08_01095 [Sphingomonas sp. LM7]|nr:hypothetical protein BXU08_01095 [Sphingomonas sp. LM7]